MRENTVKRTLAAEGVALGSFAFEFPSRGIGRMAAAAGADFLLYDMEHTGWSLETIGWLVAATGEGVVPMVRVPAGARHFVSPALDLGALGVMVPMVGSAQAAREVVAAAKYPPLGTRGVAFGMAHDDYRPGEHGEGMRRANAETFLIAQIETTEGLEAVEAIAAVEGIDALWVGQSDLTASLGFPGRFEEPRFTEALSRVARAATERGKAAGYMATSPEEAERVLGLGYRLLALWGDGPLYVQALRGGLEQIRSGLPATAR